ncbi:MAG: DUF6473 family protein [Pseudomonadota bacterium]
MFHDRSGLGGPNYFACRYAASRVTYRGPPVNTDYPYIAFIGASETFGPFVEAPFPTLVAEDFGVQAMNLGVRNAGPDVHLHSRGVLDLTQGALATIVQVPLVANLSNRFYRVHPRRNDRVIQAMPDLLARAPMLDLCDVHFIGHFWAELARQAPDVLPVVQDEVERTWVERMQLLLDHVAQPAFILWVEPWGPPRAQGLPVTRKLLEAIEPYADDQIGVRPSQAAKVEGASTLIFGTEDRAKAAYAMNAAAHRDVAGAILEVMRPEMTKARA